MVQIVLTFEAVTSIVLFRSGYMYMFCVLFIMMYKEVLTFGSLNEILECNYSVESYWTVLSCAGTVYYAVQVGYNIWAAFK